jgi:2-oxoglutarate ferredoxin oxidoreductase subunit beta
VARGYDVARRLPDRLKAACRHKGAAFVEIFQNCIVHDKDVFAEFTEKKNADEGQLWLADGQPMLLAKGSKGIALDPETLSPRAVAVSDGDRQGAGVIVRAATNRAIAHMPVEMPFGPFPMALGVIHDDPARTVEAEVATQTRAVTSGKVADLRTLVSGGQTWRVGRGPAAD